MIDKQTLSIFSELNRYKPCELKTKYIDSLDKVSMPILKDILSNNFIKGADMKAVLCLFDTIFLSLSAEKQDGIYVLTKEVKKYINALSVLSSGADGTVYNATFFSDIQLVIKLSNNEEQEDEEEQEKKNKEEREMIIREYYIGIKAMNKLRYIVPNFVYTLGCFMCDKPSNTNPIDKLCESSSDKPMPFIVYEKIPGKKVADLIDNKEDPLTFQNWLVIFFQLLLALEVAQREVGFTHFDLHDCNVMIREEKTFNYSVPLDMSTYTIKDPRFIPVIIDFGRSTCTVDTQNIGTYERESLGVLNHMVPGQDMYVFMSYCCNKISDINVKKKIALLFNDFYGDDDPYPITIGTRTNRLTKETQEYVGKLGTLESVSDCFQKVAVTPVGHYTPLMFMKWLLVKYSDELGGCVIVTDRKMCNSLQYSIMVKKYNEIFDYVTKGIDKATNLLITLSNFKESYVITKYVCTLLERYNKDLHSSLLDTKIKEANAFLDKNKQDLIKIDMDMLENVFDIEIPSQEELDKCISVILNLKIYIPWDMRMVVAGVQPKLYSFNLEPITTGIKQLNSVLDYEDKLKSYLKFYFTILELHLEEVEFNGWVTKFKSSPIYEFYTKNYLQNERARRWSKTLLISSKSNEKAS